VQVAAILVGEVGAAGAAAIDRDVRKLEVGDTELWVGQKSKYQKSKYKLSTDRGTIASPRNKIPLLLFISWQKLLEFDDVAWSTPTRLGHEIRSIIRGDEEETDYFIFICFLFTP